MSTTQFDRDAMARWYARQHLKTDPGVKRIYYLPTDSPDREVRFLEINDLLADIGDAPLEPLDFGVDTGTATEHKLYVVDVTPSQWDLIQKGLVSLPVGWTLDGAIHFD